MHCIKLYVKNYLESLEVALIREPPYDSTCSTSSSTLSLRNHWWKTTPPPFRLFILSATIVNSGYSNVINSSILVPDWRFCRPSWRAFGIGSFHRANRLFFPWGLANVFVSTCPEERGNRSAPGSRSKKKEKLLEKADWTTSSLFRKQMLSLMFLKQKKDTSTQYKLMTFWQVSLIKVLLAKKEENETKALSEINECVWHFKDLFWPCFNKT